MYKDYFFSLKSRHTSLQCGYKRICNAAIQNESDDENERLSPLDQSQIHHTDRLLQRDEDAFEVYRPTNSPEANVAQAVMFGAIYSDSAPFPHLVCFIQEKTTPFDLWAYKIKAQRWCSLCGISYRRQPQHTREYG